MGENGLRCDISYSTDSEFETPTYISLDELNYLLCEPSTYTKTIGGDVEKLTIAGYDLEVHYSFTVTLRNDTEERKYYVSPYLSMDVFDKENKEKRAISYSNSYPNYYDKDSKKLSEGNIRVFIGSSTCEYEFPGVTGEEYIKNILLNQKEITDDGNIIFLGYENDWVDSKEESLEICNNVIDDGYGEIMYNDVIVPYKEKIDKLLIEGEEILNDNN